MGSENMYLVSACLCGINCKYNGGNNLNEKVLKLVKEGRAIPICAEQLGGLTTPRIPVEIRYINRIKRAFNSNGDDVTEYFVKGAKEVLKVAKSLNINKAILQPRSPSCGSGKIYDGSFSGVLIDGNGFLAEILKDNGIEVISSDDL